jgi:hypothetical protein
MFVILAILIGELPSQTNHLKVVTATTDVLFFVTENFYITAILIPVIKLWFGLNWVTLSVI